jgi:hypothetical protein
MPKNLFTFLKKVLAPQKIPVILTTFWGEQQAIVAIVAVACIFLFRSYFPADPVGYRARACNRL